MLRPLLFASCLSAPLAGTSALAQTGDDLGDALTQPLHDLSILRRESPAVLQRAGVAPYADAEILASGALDCSSVADEIDALDSALGRDVSGVTAPASLMVQARNEVSNAIVDAVGDVFELPYRSVIRRLTGAHRRDREMRQAVEAGLVRRAFLRGLSARECAQPQLQAAFDPPPAPPLSDLELARAQLAAANEAAAARVFASAPAVITVAAADLSEVAHAPMQLAAQPAVLVAHADPAPAPQTRLSDLELARMQLAAANAAAAEAATLWQPINESRPAGELIEARLSDLELARMQLAAANAAATGR